MTTLAQLYENLGELINSGVDPNLEVFYRHTASSDCGPVSSFHVTNRVDECGPFVLEEGQDYVELVCGW